MGKNSMLSFWPGPKSIIQPKSNKDEYFSFGKHPSISSI